MYSSKLIDTWFWSEGITQTPLTGLYGKQICQQTNNFLVLFYNLGIIMNSFILGLITLMPNTFLTAWMY